MNMELYGYTGRPLINQSLRKAESLEAMLNTQPNTQLVRDALLRGETVYGAQARTKKSHPD